MNRRDIMNDVMNDVVNKKFEQYEKKIVVLLLAIFFTTAVASMAQEAATSDEVAHLTAGYAYLKEGDYRFNEEHPPLVKLIAAVPLLIINPKFPLNSRYWDKEPDQWKFAKDFLYSGKNNPNNPDQLFFWGRLPLVFLGVLLGFYVFRWAKELYGAKAGMLALFFYSFSPEILAHTKYVHTDLAMSAGLLITTYYFWRLLEHPTWKNTLIAGICLGLTNAAKFTGVYLFPILTVLWMIHFYEKKLKRDINNIRSEENKRYIRLFLEKGIMMILITILIVAATYGFVHAGRYLDGLKYVINHSTNGQETFLLGEYSIHGWWYYFVVAFFIKTPLTTIIFLMITLVFFKRIKHQDITNELFIIVPAVLYFISFMVGHLNIGVRHILPVYPFIFIFVSKAVNIRIEKRGRQRVIMLIGGILLLWYLVASVKIYPHYIEYFNELVGGSDNGYRYLLDSNIDWGQDTKLLKEWLVENNADNQDTRISLFSNELINNPKGYNDFYRFQNTKLVSCQPTPGIVAISVNKLYDLGQRQKGCADWLKQYAPFKKIGYSIFLYNITNERLIKTKNECEQLCIPSCQEQNQTYYDYYYKEKCMCICE